MGHLEESTVKVLVVDDYEPFRRFTCSTLAKRQNLKVIGEASDGLEAVRKTEELKPDLIVLDIGLPTLNGIEVARQVRNLHPECKILFMSQYLPPLWHKKPSTWGHWATLLKCTRGVNYYPLWTRFVKDGTLSARGSRATIGSAPRTALTDELARTSNVAM